MSHEKLMTVSEALAVAGQYLDSGRLEAAEQLLLSVNKAQPGNAHVFSSLASVARKQGDLEQAVRWLKKAVDIAPDEPAHAGNLGNLYRAMGAFEESVACYRKVLDAIPDSVAAYTNLGLALKAMGEADQAIAAYRKAIELDPEAAEAAGNLGIALLETNRPEEAVEVLRAALRKRPGWTTVQTGLGWALRRLGRLDEAIAVYRDVLRENPDHAETQNNLGNALKEARRFPEAMDCYLQAIRIDPVSATAHRNLAHLYRQTGQFQSAANVYRQAVALQPEDPELIARYAEALQRQGILDEAETQYAKALEIDPDNANARAGLADLYAATGRRGLVDDPDHKAAAHIVAALKGRTTDAAPHTHVASTFDSAAPEFERQLVGKLGYQGHRVLVEILCEGLASRAIGKVLDLGCGTGLFGRELKKSFNVAQLVGVDLSPKMIEIAAGKGGYDRLECSEVVEFLRGAGDEFDLVSASDVLVYMGNLTSLFAQVRDKLLAGGVFCFLVEETEEGDFTLTRSGRYAHSVDYLDRLIAEHGFEIAAGRKAEIRSEFRRPVMGNYYLLRCAKSSPG